MLVPSRQVRSCSVPTYPLELCPERAPVTQRHPHHEFLQQFLQVFFKDVIFSQVRGVSAPIAHLPPPPKWDGRDQPALCQVETRGAETKQTVVAPAD